MKALTAKDAKYAFGVLIGLAHAAPMAVAGLGRGAMNAAAIAG